MAINNRNLSQLFENVLILFSLSREVSWRQLIIDMIPSHFPVLSLTGMCSIKIAIAIGHDPEVKAVEKKHKLFDTISTQKNFHWFLTREDERCIRWRAGIPSELQERDFPPIRPTARQPQCYCDRDISAEFEYFWRSKELRENSLFFNEWSDLVLKKISSLSLPAKYRNMLLSLVRYVRLEIKKWVRNHREIFRWFDEPTRFQWKSSGKINYEETVKGLIRNESLDIKTSYVLASIYYLKDDAVLLPSKDRINFGEMSSMSYNYPFLEVWNNWVKEERDGTIDWDNLADNRTGLDRALRDASLWRSHYHIGLRNLFTKLSTGKKLQWLIYSIEKETIDNEEFLFCLSHLEGNHENLFRNHPFRILGYFLDWPLQCKFLEAAEILWTFLSGRMFFFLLHFIIYEKILEKWDDYDYFHLLREFWHQSPIHLKECIKMKNIYQVVMLAIDHGDTSSFYDEIIVKYCEHITFAFHFPRLISVS
ncbi:uncharacterized protein NPIL_318781 [Nephila pilipes]|uniref:Uncharacterized protein n=1 Tax=Nephila pilipes TaxID=299642 RepID=A0A8X6R4L5_NEPPI|nr:uncharacterized protein NPIL_318781 [Nephila pilipes]